MSAAIERETLVAAVQSARDQQWNVGHAAALLLSLAHGSEIAADTLDAQWRWAQATYLAEQLKGHVASLEKALDVFEVSPPVHGFTVTRPPAARPMLYDAELSAMVEGVFALALSLRSVENDTMHDTAPEEKESVRDTLIYQLFDRSRELRNLVETGNIQGAETAPGGAA